MRENDTCPREISGRLLAVFAEDRFCHHCFVDCDLYRQKNQENRAKKNEQKDGRSSIGKIHCKGLSMGHHF